MTGESLTASIEKLVKQRVTQAVKTAAEEAYRECLEAVALEMAGRVKVTMAHALGEFQPIVELRIIVEQPKEIA